MRILSRIRFHLYSSARRMQHVMRGIRGARKRAMFSPVKTVVLEAGTGHIVYSCFSFGKTCIPE